MKANDGKGFPQKRVTMIDVAKAAGVSKSTVSLVLNGSESVSDEKKKRVNEACRTLGYVYNGGAASLRGGRSKIVAILSNNLTSPYFSQIIKGLEPYLDELGFIPVIMDVNESLERQNQFVHALRGHNVAGIIITPAPGTDNRWIDDIVATGLPIISIMREVENSLSPAVMAENRLGTYLATRSLIELGHKHIAFVGGLETFIDLKLRHQGFMDAMDEAGLTVPDNYIQHSPSSRSGGHEATTRLLSLAPEVTAIVCFTDVVAYGVYTALHEAGKQPGEDVSVIGFDDLEDSRLIYPALSTVRVKGEDIAREACYLLQRLLAQQQTPNKILVGVELIQRLSTQAPKSLV
ncbi:LacI family DNA-binding transcriptional regulator [Grimontia sp. SpTr1]|uniref:LacI family DNA-binding transcriptional regulator n=1 Tax=Grimontia sp. SpTr1 TaxID=2995319 RepID=UPI00248BB260|nr:LacI family DNA-binding transcriptional regulator [Grimontia sp. SpTr1]